MPKSRGLAPALSLDTTSPFCGLDIGALQSSAAVQRIRKRLSYANVMSSIAVFLVLGDGAAYAAQKIGSHDFGAAR
jgi:hypothetical protein